MNGERCWALDDFARLIELLRAEGRTVVGPTVRDGVIAYDEIGSLADLPRGWTDQHAPGRYGLARRDPPDDALFGFACGPQSFKPYFLPPRLTLLTMRRQDGTFAVEEAPPAAPPLALLGARGCDLAAIAVQDRALNHPQFGEPHYAARRRDVFIVAVECGEPRQSCFCASLGTGPGVTTGFDIALTELFEGGHRFLARPGSDAGQTMLERVGGRAAWSADLEAAAAVVARARAAMPRALDVTGLPELLQESRSHPRWDDVATRCMGCGNCTMVCPTCFCTTVEDVNDLAGEVSERVRRWDSCFTLGFSYVFGGPVRQSVAARYRQWLTHKLSSWRTQYGVMGCVGCGRCITWCPAGIDITQEAAAIREGAPPRRSSHPVAEVPR